MKHVRIDFRKVGDVADFYRQFAQAFALERAFGANLDALWDALTGMIELPSTVTLTHLAEHENPGQFADVIAVMREAEEELDGLLQIVLR